MAFVAILLVAFFCLFGVYIPYTLRFDKTNPEYELEKIDLNNHRNQPNDLIYSIDVDKLKGLVNSSDSIYQMVYFYSLTCPTVKKCTASLKDSIFDLPNTEVFAICVSDRTLKSKLKEQMSDISLKKYMIDSEKYYSYFFDMYEHNNNAKTNFINAIQSKKFYEGTYAILFKKWDNILFYDDSQYYQKYYTKDMTINESLDKFVQTITNDIYEIIIKK